MSFVRISAGDAKGRKIQVPPGNSVRPPRDAVRQAVFNIIGPDVHGASVLDLFAGSGSFGIEALSRGASRAVFVEKNPATFTVLEQNISTCGFTESSIVVKGDSMDFIDSVISGKAPGSFDLVFADPPYALSSGPLLLELVEALSSPLLTQKSGSRIILHVEAISADPAVIERLPGSLELRKYGRNLLCLSNLP